MPKSEPPSAGPDEGQRPAVAGPPGRRVVDSTALLGQASELGIRHEGEIYTLRRTSKGKLILTK